MKRHLVLLLFVRTFVLAQGDQKTGESVVLLGSKVDSLQREVASQRVLVESQRALLEKRLDIHQESVGHRFENIELTFQHMYWMFGIVATLATLFTLMSWRTYQNERKFYETRMKETDTIHRDHYEKERSFYESRMRELDMGQRENYAREREFYESHTRHADNQKTALTDQQIVLGQTVISRSDSLLKEQIESIAKLKDVIGLVRESFQLQISRESDLKSATALLTELNQHFTDSYVSLSSRILSIGVKTFMDWPRLSAYQAELAAGCRTEFRAIPRLILNEQEKADPYGYAKTCQFLGASALYANDIGYSEKLLKLSRNSYRALSHREDHAKPKAAASFFLGLIAKSWLEQHARLLDGLRASEEYLREALELLPGSGEFLVPITLCEVRSYIEGEKAAVLQDLAARLLVLEGLGANRDENQTKLLTRGLLIRGNIEADNTAKLKAFERAQELDDKNPYPVLCIAFLTRDALLRRQHFEKGLGLLKASSALEKPEVTTRATALVWAVVATYELGDTGGRTRHLATLERLASAAISTGGRVPFFFCPITKELCRFETLQENARAYPKTMAPEASA